MIYLDNKILCFVKGSKSRTIVRVFIDGTPQLFYRSTGSSSGMPGVFLPFDGILMVYDMPIWFNKSRFVNNPERPNDKRGFGELHRFGTVQMKRISDALGKLNIPQGKITTNGHEINAWLEEPFILGGCPYEQMLTNV